MDCISVQVGGEERQEEEGEGEGKEEEREKCWTSRRPINFKRGEESLT